MITEGASCATFGASNGTCLCHYVPGICTTCCCLWDVFDEEWSIVFCLKAHWEILERRR